MRVTVRRCDAVSLLRRGTSGDVVRLWELLALAGVAAFELAA